MTKIVVGVDGSVGAQDALRWAAAEAKLMGLPLVALMAWGYLDQHHVAPGAFFEPGYHEADAHVALASYVVAALGPRATDDVEMRPVCDLPASALLAAGEDAALLVVGARGRGGFASLLVGSVSQKVLHHATCPVAVVRPNVERNLEGSVERIVVGVDGSAGADAALRWALDEGRLRGANIEVVHAWHMPYVAPFLNTTVDCDAGVFDDAAHDLIDDAISRARPTGHDHITKSVSPSGAAVLLLDAAKGADLLVVGSRGLGVAKAALLGSVSHQVTLHAACPVVVVPEEST